MILGVGIDLCRVSRMMKAVRSPHFVERVFRPGEIRYAQSKGNERARAASFAAAFAAREAFVKASGVPLALAALGGGVTLVRREGRPELELSGAVRERLSPLGPVKAWVSLTHEGDYAAAVVVLESA